MKILKTEMHEGVEWTWREWDCDEENVKCPVPEDTPCYLLTTWHIDKGPEEYGNFSRAGWFFWGRVKLARYAVPSDVIPYDEQGLEEEWEWEWEWSDWIENIERVKPGADNDRVIVAMSGRLDSPMREAAVCHWIWTGSITHYKIKQPKQIIEKKEIDVRNVNLYAYKAGSKSGKALAAALGVKRVAHRNSKYIGRAEKTIINWGKSSLPDEVLKSTILNHPDNVAVASNKLKAFEAMADTCIPDYTSDKGIAQGWIDEGIIVVARQKLTGNSGEGIVLCGLLNKGKENEEQVDLVEAPLYVKYVPKASEYRIHVFNGKVFDRQRKARNMDIPREEVNWQIRNHDNGFIFKRNEIEIEGCVEEECLKAVKALGLDFGAVDVIFNARQEKAYVLEVNTACGLEGTTLENYSKVFSEHLGA